MPSSALKLVSAASVDRPTLEPEDELEQLWRRETEIRASLAVNLALQNDAARRFASKHRLAAFPRLETVKAGIIAARAKEARR